MVAVLKELRRRNQSVELRFWCDKKFAPQARNIIDSFDDSIPIHIISAGKFRRYHNLSKLWQLTYPPIVLANIRDLFLIGIGFIQSIFKLIIWRPDVVFTKGGFVCLPVGIASRLLHIPLVIHDSDAHPGLTNRILARFATHIATGAPLEYYNYPKDRSTYVGIPIDASFKSLSPEEQTKAKQSIGVQSDKPLVVVTGGGLGAKRINDATLKVAPRLTREASVLLISGRAQYEEIKQRLPDLGSSFKLYDFISGNMPEVLGAADVVVSRAGATTLLELAALAKPTIIIPNARLTGGHQLKNAKVYQDKGAIRIIDEHALKSDPNVLVEAISDLLGDPESAFDMGEKFSKLARPGAASDMAEIILTSIKNK